MTEPGTECGGMTGGSMTSSSASDPPSDCARAAAGSGGAPDRARRLAAGGVRTASTLALMDARRKLVLVPAPELATRCRRAAEALDSRTPLDVTTWPESSCAEYVVYREPREVSKPACPTRC